MIIWVAMFCFSAGLLIWAYAGYAMWVIKRAARIGQVRPTGGGQATVAIVIAARNEAARIEAKLRSLLAMRCPQLREVIVVCDHCTDNTAQCVDALADSRVICVPHDNGASGKAAALNAGVAAATSELILFNDVRQTLAEDALPLLAAWFAEPSTGAVSGALDIQSSGSGTGRGLDAYWSLEKRIRHAESVLDSSVGCTGAIYMIRRELFETLPADTILDDVVVPMRIAQRGYRVRFDPEARAFDPQPLTGEQEARRKTRTLAGNFQMLARYPQWLLPWRHRLWFDLLSHKYLRIFSPLLLLACGIATAILSSLPFFRLLLAVELGVCGLAVLGMALPGLRARVVTIPAAFVMLQLSVVKGFAFWVGSCVRGLEGWK